jgi:hypothetical protein
MNLHSLLGLPETINGESLPVYLSRITRPAPKPTPDVLDAGLAEWREESQVRNAIDREAMLTRIRDRRIGVYSDPKPGDLERQHQINKRMDAAEAALNGVYDDE